MKIFYITVNTYMLGYLDKNSNLPLKKNVILFNEIEVIK